MKNILQQILLFLTTLASSTYGYPLVTGFRATATARLEGTDSFDRREVVPTQSSSYLKIVVPTDSSLLVDMKQGSKLFVEMNKRKKRYIRGKRDARSEEDDLKPTIKSKRSLKGFKALPNIKKVKRTLENPKPTAITASFNKPSPKASLEERFIIDSEPEDESDTERFQDDEEEDDEDVAPTDATSLARDTEEEPEKETEPSKAPAAEKSIVDESESGSGLNSFESRSDEEDDDSDEDVAVRPTESAERKAHIQRNPRNENETEERKMKIERQQDDEMNRLMKLEADIESMAKDFSVTKRKRNRIGF